MRIHIYHLDPLSSETEEATRKCITQNDLIIYFLIPTTIACILAILSIQNDTQNTKNHAQQDHIADPTSRNHETERDKEKRQRKLCIAYDNEI